MTTSRAYQELNDYINELYGRSDITGLKKINVRQSDLYFDEMQRLEEKIYNKIEILTKRKHKEEKKQQQSGFGGNNSFGLQFKF